MNGFNKYVIMSYKPVFIRYFAIWLASILSCSCTLLLLNGNLSLGIYEAKSATFKCKLPGGALSKSVDVVDRMNDLGETVTFTLDIGLLWRLDHLRVGKHKLAIFETSVDKRLQLDQAKDNYMGLYLTQNADQVEVDWEQYIVVNDVEVLLTSTYVKWDDQEEKRELLFSIDGDYLNVVHYAQNVSSNLQNFTTNATSFYKGCEFY